MGASAEIMIVADESSSVHERTDCILAGFSAVHGYNHLRITGSAKVTFPNGCPNVVKRTPPHPPPPGLVYKNFAVKSINAKKGSAWQIFLPGRLIANVAFVTLGGGCK